MASVPEIDRSHCLHAEKRALTSAEGYLNRYRNGWGASAGAVKAWVDEAARRRGKPLPGQAPVPVHELPVPVPISRFLWPFVSLLCRHTDHHQTECKSRKPAVTHIGLLLVRKKAVSGLRS